MNPAAPKPSRTQQRLSLTRLLRYRHEGTLERYCKESGASRAEAEEVFIEMLKFLYLAYRVKADRRNDVVCAIFPEVEKIDWMWHTFILFTWDYTLFCHKFFGFYLHHYPTLDGDVPAKEVVQERVLKLFEFIYDVLGEETLLAWYDDCRYQAPAKS
jgi:hypothetical protein